MNIEFHVKCKLCGNEEDSEFYYCPIEEKTLDGKLYSYTKYKFVCKKCNQDFILELREEMDGR